MINVIKNNVLMKELVKHARVISMGQIAMELAHDSRNVIQSINALISVLIDTIPQNVRIRPEMQEIITTLTTDTDHLRTLFERLTNYTRVTVGELDVHNLREIIDSVVWLFHHRLAKRRVNLDLSQLAKNILIDCDRYQMEQVFIHLLNNSLAAVRDARLNGAQTNQQIKIFTEQRSKKEIGLFFMDDGVGIPKEQLSQIFEPFFTTREKQSLGLGLAICKHIIEDYHKGKITVESTFGERTTFRILLPIRSKQRG